MRRILFVFISSSLFFARAFAFQDTAQISIDKWLDFVDLKTEIESDRFAYKDVKSVAIWTETDSDSVLILNLKVFKGTTNTNITTVKLDDIPNKSIIDYANKWLFTIAFVSFIHIDGQLWRPKFSMLRVKMNGKEIYASDISNELHVKGLQK